MRQVIIVGGGAAGFFTAINAKEMNPSLDIIILEKGREVLQKVKVSGGGRCNVTHACFEPKELVTFYPRGEKELLGPFHQFMTGDTCEWFSSHGIPLKIESDQRVFPESNTSQTIIDCFLEKRSTLEIPVFKNHGVTAVTRQGDQWMVNTKEEQFVCDALVIAAGSSKQVWKLSKSLGHSGVDPVPSLFTFNIKDDRIQGLLGVSVPQATVKLSNTSLEATGPLLITHWGMSEPAVLRLSAFGARILAEMNYEYQVEVNWISQTPQDTLIVLQNTKKEQSKRQVSLKSPFAEVPRRLWERLVTASSIKTSQNWADISKIQLQNLVDQLTKATFYAKGKSTFKEEFVTADGVDLREINFKRFESRLHKNLFFVGEVLNIDGVTGGFNFQNAWTGSWIVAKSLAED